MKIVSNDEIDRKRWDACIRASANGLIYGTTTFLDRMAPGWTAMKGEDYEWVLPVTGRRKWGIPYLYQPAFLQQLGVFSHPASQVPFNEIIGTLKHHYKFWEINWNHLSAGNLFQPSFSVNAATNFVLPLDANFSILSGRFSNDLKRNLKKAKDLSYAGSSNFEHLISLYKQLYGDRLYGTTKEDYDHFIALCHDLHREDKLICREVRNGNKILLAGVVLLKDERRLYNLVNCVPVEGRKGSANHYLFASLIEEFAGTGLLLDFEGSDLPGVKSFYSNFGAIDEPFYKVRYNRLPLAIRWVK